MKTIIAGGRHYELTAFDVQFLDRMRVELPITEVVCGGASGADQDGWEWAYNNEIPITLKPAAWSRWGVEGAVVKTRPDGSKYNALAGLWRNQEMADYAEALIAFPGGSGTADMIERATNKGLKVIRMNVIQTGVYFNPLNHEQTK